MSDFTIFVLAGGKSSRMGADKAFLEIGGSSLLDRSLRLAHSVGSDVRILGPLDKFSSHGPTVPDVYPDRGPLAAIHAALAASTSDLNLMIAVDLPFLEVRFLSWLLEQARENSGAVVTVPTSGGRLQPLCAVYRHAFAETAARALQDGFNKIDPLFAVVPTRILNQQILTKLGFSAEMFDNLNTPEDLERVQARLHHPSNP